MTPPTPSPPQGTMPVMEHLGELRLRLFRAAAAVCIGMLATFAASEHVIAWLARPLIEPLVFISPAEAFWANLKVAFLTGLLVAMPFVLYQAWKFVSPGLYRKERRLGAAFIIAGTLLFMGGMAFCAWVVFPFAIDFLLTYKTAGITPMLSVGMYVDFNVKFFLAFGIIFELPAVITLLARLGLITPDMLTRNRKYAVLGAFIIAAILTPTPDVFNQLLMVAPLLVLYELGVISARLFGGSRTPPREERSGQ